MIGALISLAFSISAFVICYLQFREKGYLFNNAYLWASKAERQRMDENRESKRPHYRQSGFVFLFLGAGFLALAIYSATYKVWSYIAFWAFVVIAAVYALVSSVLIQRHK